jgi:hypothetical protein
MAASVQDGLGIDGALLVLAAGAGHSTAAGSAGCADRAVPLSAAGRSPPSERCVLLLRARFSFFCALAYWVAVAASEFCVRSSVLGHWLPLQLPGLAGFSNSGPPRAARARKTRAPGRRKSGGLFPPPGGAWGPDGPRAAGARAPRGGGVPAAAGGGGRSGNSFARGGPGGLRTRGGAMAKFRIL